MTGRWPMAVIVMLAWSPAAACQGPPKSAAPQPPRVREKEKTMKTVVNHLSAEVFVTPQPRKLEELRVTVTVKNESDGVLRFNGQYFTAPALMLRFEDAKGQPVPTGGPPLPAEDDGKVGRLDLKPGETVSHTY
ncbi:MAG: hypothetical protein IT162_10205, partial [Bryobacterales bacterium]|nr:hypothetical protein [Bryobacterales bacterium]